MKVGIIGLDCFLCIGLLLFFVPLISVVAIFSLISTNSAWPFVRGGISKEGDGEGLVSDGVSICWEVVLELDLECDFVLRGFPPNDLLFVVLLIAQGSFQIQSNGQEKKKWSCGEDCVVLTKSYGNSKALWSVMLKLGKLAGVWQGGQTWLGNSGVVQLASLNPIFQDQGKR